MMRRGAALAAVVAALLSAMFVPVAHADTPGIFGYNMTATADGISFIYDQPSFGLPAPHTFELHNVHATTAIDSGPSAHGLSSVLWPGDVVGNAGLALALQLFVADPTSKMLLDCGSSDPGSALQSELQALPTQPHCVPILDAWRDFYNQFTTGYQKNTGQPFDPPPYPERAETFYPQGPSDAKNPIGTIDMTSHADPTITKADVTMNQAGFPGAISVGTLTSHTLSGVVDGKAVSQASTYVGDVNIAGEVHIGSIEISLTAESDGQNGTLPSPVVEVSDFTIHGQAIVVDGTGMHAGGATADPYGMVAKKLIDTYLAPQGISLTIGGPLNTVDGASASTVADGLVIGLSAKGMQSLVKQMPVRVQQLLGSPSTDPLLSPVLGQVTPFWQGIVNSPTQFDQQISIVFGSGLVSSAASPTFNFPLPEIPVPGVPSVSPPSVGSTLPSNPLTQTAPQTQGRQPAQLGVQVAKVLGVPAGIAVAALVLAALLAIALNRFAERAITAAPAESCELERE